MKTLLRPFLATAAMIVLSCNNKQEEKQQVKQQHIRQEASDLIIALYDKAQHKKDSIVLSTKDFKNIMQLYHHLKRDDGMRDSIMQKTDAVIFRDYKLFIP